jgi:outer membrane protein assembly factor BamB
VEHGEDVAGHAGGCPRRRPRRERREGHVDADTPSTGRLRWRLQITVDGGSSPPTLANGVLYFGGNANRIYALDAATGKLRWRFLTGSDVRSSPAVVNGMAHMGSSDGKIYAFGLGDAARISAGDARRSLVRRSKIAQPLFASVPAKICHARADFATRLRITYMRSPYR